MATTTKTWTPDTEFFTNTFKTSMATTLTAWKSTLELQEKAFATAMKPLIEPENLKQLDDDTRETVKEWTDFTKETMLETNKFATEHAREAIDRFETILNDWPFPTNPAEFTKKFQNVTEETIERATKTGQDLIEFNKTRVQATNEFGDRMRDQWTTVVEKTVTTEKPKTAAKKATPTTA